MVHGSDGGFFRPHERTKSAPETYGSGPPFHASMVGFRHPWQLPGNMVMASEERVGRPQFFVREKMCRASSIVEDLSGAVSLKGSVKIFMRRYLDDEEVG